jgi:hypothetical protein
MLRQERSEAVEELYRKALSIAQKQEARLWELRRGEPCSAAPRPGPAGRSPRSSRAGLWLFYDGFDTPNLKESKALLEGLT